MYSSTSNVIRYISLVLMAHGLLAPRLPNHDTSCDINMIDKLTANTITTGAKITLSKSPMLYLRIGILSITDPIESWNDRLSTKNGDSAINTQSIPTLTSITSAVSNIGKNKPTANRTLINHSITSARSLPLLVWMLNCAKLSIEEYNVINGHIIPLLESSRFFIVRTPVSLNADRAGFAGIAYNGAMP